jgi:hypothetical protein
MINIYCKRVIGSYIRVNEFKIVLMMILVQLRLIFTRQN